jgi:hypothetical protein
LNLQNIFLLIFDDIGELIINDTLNSSTFYICKLLKNLKNLKVIFNSEKKIDNPYRLFFLNNYLEIN